MHIRRASWRFSNTGWTWPVVGGWRKTTCSIHGRWLTSSKSLSGVSRVADRLPLSILRIRIQISPDSIFARDRLREEPDRLHQPLVRLRATEADESVSGFAEAFPTQACDSLLVVGRFEQVHRQPMRSHSEPVADRGDVGQRIE